MACSLTAAYRLPLRWLPAAGRGHTHSNWEIRHDHGKRSYTPSLAASATPSPNLAELPLHQLMLADLVKHGKPPLSTEALLASANFTSKLIPIRLAHRVRALIELPYIVVTNPNIARIYKNYQASLRTLEPFHDHDFTTLEEEIRFTDALADLVQTHANTIPVLAKGFLECRKYVTPDAVTRFLDEHLRARIGTRLIAEQHLALHVSSLPHAGPEAVQESSHDTYVGVIDTALRPTTTLTLCEDFVGELCELKYGVRPSIVVNGSPNATIAQIPMHLEYILTELLKNAFRATIESGNESHPIEVTIAVSQGDPGSKAKMSEGKVGGGTHAPGDETLTMRIRDRGGGIAPEHLEQIWRYSFTTFKEGGPRGTDLGSSGGVMQNDALDALSAAGNDTSTIAGLGYGLPLSRAYAEYFGGSIQLESLWGWGTDVYLTMKGLRGIGNAADTSSAGTTQGH